ncbi:MAG: hypothetical protein K9M54_03700 [Kiritimatiellales bacterium]|nr:hypothetical protein [Kiritimatiellales bacterium]
MNQPRTSCIEQARADVQDCLVVGAKTISAVAATALAGMDFSCIQQVYKESSKSVSTKPAFDQR